MGKFKGFVKRVANGLKCLPVAIGIACLGGGFLAGIGGLIACPILDSKANKYVETEIYKQLMEEDIEKAKEAHESGEMDDYEYQKQREYMLGSDYMHELIMRDYPENEKFQGYYKGATAAAYAAAAGCPASLAVGAILTLGYPAFVNIEDSWENFRYGCDDDPPKPSKKDMNKVSRTPHITIVSEPALEEEQGEVLPNIEDTCYND